MRSPQLPRRLLIRVAVPTVAFRAAIALVRRGSYSIFNAAGATWEWAAFYAISIAIEVLLLVFILRSAWTWPGRPRSLPDPSAPGSDRRSPPPLRSPDLPVHPRFLTAGSSRLHDCDDRIEHAPPEESS
jgi:hypothetical protein